MQNWYPEVVLLLLILLLTISYVYKCTLIVCSPAFSSPIYLSSSLLISFSYSCLLFCLCPSGLDHGYQCGLCIGTIHWSLVHQCLYNWQQQAPLTQIPLVACSSVPRDRAPQSPPQNHSPFMNDWVKVLAMQTWQPEFLPRIHVRVERRKPNP